MKKTTIYDIAKKLNITAATVSRALNDSPRISEKTRELVKKTAFEMAYQQNKLALALKSGRSNNVGVIVPHINRNFFASVIQGIEEELSAHNFHVIITQTHNDSKKEIENLDALLNAQIDGVLMSVSGAMENEEHLKALLKKNVPIIFFDKKRDIEGISSVTIDDFQGGYDATQHLIEEGCTRIAHFIVNKTEQIYQERFRGYKEALEDNGIPYDENYVIELESDIEEGKKGLKQLLKMENPPDAIFSSSDFAALGAIQELRAQKIKVPEEFCVVGFSNEPFTKFMILSISTVEQFPVEMGQMAAKVFLEQINGGNTRIEKKVVLSPKLYIRKSSSRKEALKLKEEKVSYNETP
ncbi:MAG: LacI family DNA-binding transcriptional regulator [Cyclobacteriaceae bacterium]|nr:LacI family DNA-binding transcriptional regulator [Cyclobacteriaceae bacterium]